MLDVIFVGFFGALGAIVRWALSNMVYRLVGSGFAYGTLIVNLAGCFLLGLVMQVTLSGDYIGARMRTALTVGFLGAFTTFSTFSYETIKYIEDGVWSVAIANIGANVVFGLAATILGLAAGKLVAGGA